jgi:hypothetical protein
MAILYAKAIHREKTYELILGRAIPSVNSKIHDLAQFGEGSHFPHLATTVATPK